MPALVAEPHRVVGAAVRDRERARALEWAIVAAAVAAGVALRVWVLDAFGAIDSDEAIVGLMAQDALDGEFHVFFWLQYYSGTQEVLLTALLFAVTGASTFALKLVPILLYAAAAVVTWRVGIRTVGASAARAGALLMWVWPPFFVYHSAKARAAYGMGVLCAALAVLLMLRVRDSESRIDASALGFVIGCGVWSTPQSLVMALPAVAWLVWRCPRVVRLAPYALLGGVVGGAPWIAWNITHGFRAVAPQGALEDSTYWSRLFDLFTTVLPEALGLRLAFSRDWVVPAVVGVLLTAAVLVWFAWTVARRPRGTEVLCVIVAVYPLLYAASPFTYFTDEPRYLVFVAPAVALLAARHLSRPIVAAAALAVATAASAVYLASLHDQGQFRFVGQPDDMGPLISLLEREGQDRVFADYWIAYRLDFESDERIIATSTGFVRNAEYDELVKSAPDPAYVYVEGSQADSAARRRLEPRGYSRLTSGGWTAYVRR